MLRGMRTVMAVVMSAVLLSGCAGGGAAPNVPTSATRSAAATLLPLSAAKRTFDAYTKIGNQIAAEGGKNVSRIQPYVTPAEYKTELGFYKKVASSKRRLEGRTVFRNFRSQATTAAGGLTAYVCLDARNTRILDRNGHDVTPKTRVTEQTLIVKFVPPIARPLISSSQTWSGSSVC